MAARADKRVAVNHNSVIALVFSGAAFPHITILHVQFGRKFRRRAINSDRQEVF